MSKCMSVEWMHQMKARLCHGMRNAFLISSPNPINRNDFICERALGFTTLTNINFNECESIAKQKKYEWNYLLHDASFSLRKRCVSTQFIIDVFHFNFDTSFCFLAVGWRRFLLQLCITIVDHIRHATGAIIQLAKTLWAHGTVVKAVRIRSFDATTVGHWTALRICGHDTAATATIHGLTYAAGRSGQGWIRISINVWIVAHAQTNAHTVIEIIARISPRWIHFSSVFIPLLSRFDCVSLIFNALHHYLRTRNNTCDFRSPSYRITARTNGGSLGHGGVN